MSDRIRAEIGDMMKLQKERADLLMSLRMKIDAISEIAEELIAPAPEREQGDKRILARDALGSLTAGCRELQELFRFEERAVGEYREAEAEAAAIIEDMP